MRKDLFPHANPKIIHREEEDGAILFDLDNGKIRFLNETGYQIWQLCNGTLSIEEIIQQMSDNYPEVPLTRIKDDTEKFLSFLENSGLIKFKDKLDKEEK